MSAVYLSSEEEPQADGMARVLLMDRVFAVYEGVSGSLIMIKKLEVTRIV